LLGLATGLGFFIVKLIKSYETPVLNLFKSFFDFYEDFSLTNTGLLLIFLLPFFVSVFTVFASGLFEKPFLD
jgi:hypothetical protein